MHAPVMVPHSVCRNRPLQRWCKTTRRCRRRSRNWRCVGVRRCACPESASHGPLLNTPRLPSERTSRPHVIARRILSQAMNADELLRLNAELKLRVQLEVGSSCTVSCCVRWHVACGRVWVLWIPVLVQCSAVQCSAVQCNIVQ